MKKKQIYIFIFSLFSINFIVGQQIENKDNDSIVVKKKLINIDKLSIGIDLYRPIYSSINDDDLSYELITSLRIFEGFSIASEIGSLDKYVEDENVNFTSTGDYLKFGFDYNLFNNWTGMDNSIYLGMRFATSSFNNKIDSYTIRNPDSYWSNNVLDNYETINHSNQNANWIELLVGIKVETIKNIYLGISLRLNRLLSNTTPNNFNNLYIPGFNKVTDDNSWGSGFNYTLTYSLPLKFNKKASIK
ncbi:MAG: hypothetical protein H8E55_61935 [Pelagibacterales bacterium]|nr:hypothetical protein [Pelagibacterales bacterium]